MRFQPTTSESANTERNLFNNEQLIQAAVYVGQNIYSTPYPNAKGSLSSRLRANFYYQCADGTVIHRPNHNILNVLRTLVYLQPIIDYYTINGSNDIKEQLALLTQNEIEKICYILIFYTSGRENELNLSETRFKKKVFENLQNYFASRQSFTPFRDVDDLRHYANLLLASNEPREGKDKVIALLLRSCHVLDLLRCFPHYKLQKSLFKTFNENSQEKNTRNLQLLVFYAQNCIITTGDKLRTQYQIQNIHGSYLNQGFHLHLKPSRLKKLTKTGHNSIILGAKGYDENKFKSATQVNYEGITKTLQNLEQVPKPIFFIGQTEDHAYNAEKALTLIKNGNGVIRIINGSQNDISIRFEFEQLLNPNFMRPLRRKKLRKSHDRYFDPEREELIDRPEKPYIELTKQPPIESTEAIPPYKKDKSISKQSDRGKPKKTIFSKKQSYSLLPDDGIFPIFSGRRQDRIELSSFISIGTLYNLERMHHKGEQYIWMNDVKTSGRNGYFWLSNEAKKPPYKNRLSISALKAELQSRKPRKFNELLLSASLDSLEALFATKNDRAHRLAVLHASTVLSRDYGITRPLLIITGKSKPKEYTRDEILTDLIQAIRKYRKWYWRILNSFISVKEQKLLLEIIKPISPHGLNLTKNELIKLTKKFYTQNQVSAKKSELLPEECNEFSSAKKETGLNLSSVSHTRNNKTVIKSKLLISRGLFSASGRNDPEDLSDSHKESQKCAF